MDFDKYLDAWSELLEARLEQAHQHVAARISKQILPQGIWRFPTQALLLPQRPVWQRIAPMETSPAATPLLRKRRRIPGDKEEPWTPCGIGWTRPVETLTCGADQPACRWTLQHTPHEDEPSLFDPECGLLVFAAAEETAVAMLASAKWSAQIAGRTVAVHVERYEGYSEFEKALRFTAPTTPALETWLPPCYPYSRKVLHLRFDAPGRTLERDAEAVTVNLSVKVEGKVGAALSEQIKSGDDWLLLNPVPAAQMRMDWRPTDRDRRMGKIEILFDDLEGVFAAAGVDAEDWEAAPFIQDGNRTRVNCGKRATEARVYFGSRGEIGPTEFTASNEGEHAKRGEVVGDADREFEMRFDPVGGMTLDFNNPASNASRFWWHRIFLRSSMLTFGDLQEILGHLPDCNRYFDLSRMEFTLEPVNEPLPEPTRWHTYLWPSRITEPFLSYQSASHSHDQNAATIPISPIMRLILPVRANTALPDFLLKDIAHHAASYLEQNFSLGWYRIVPEMSR